MSTSKDAISKMNMAKHLLPLCPYMLIDTNVEGVEVLPSLKGNTIVLRIGTTKGVMAIPSLKLDERQWSGTLSFGGALYDSKIPWKAVLRMWVDNGPFVVWPAAATPVTSELTPPAAQDKPTRPKKKVSKSHLKVVK